MNKFFLIKKDIVGFFISFNLWFSGLMLIRRRNMMTSFDCKFFTSIVSMSLLFSLAFTAELCSQTVADKFGGFSSKSNAPINIEADELKVNDNKKTALFSGDVKAEQDGFTLRSKILEVFYYGNAASGANGKVKKLSARGKVLITTTDKQSATSEWATFDVIKQIIVLGDNVILTQGGNIIKGGQLEINLKTNQSRFINTNNNKIKKKKRIQMKIDVPNDKRKPTDKIR